MRFAVYDTGTNYLIAELRKENPVRGLVVDKTGVLSDDIAAFSGGTARLGAMKLDLMDTARLAARSIYLATCDGDRVVSYSGNALDNPEWWEYAGCEPQV